MILALDAWLSPEHHHCMALAALCAIAAVGIVSGIANVVAGAGSLITYPLLVALGIPPLAANVTNDLGIVPGNLSGVVGLRANLSGQGPLLRALVPRAVVGSLIGAAVLLLAPGGAFGWVAPPLLLAASLLTLAQPALARRVRAEHGRPPRRAMHAAVDATAVYGGYFGTGIGLIFMATLGVFVDASIRSINAIKTVLQLVSNGIAGLVFAFVAPVHWTAALALALGTLAGGAIGVQVAKTISPAAMRGVIAVVGIGAAVWLLLAQLA